ncbi:uncharacterized protein BT62DRAFT_1080234 [Guyanagaster necrorhizus]|uniref:Uncharacterized protein n=1 Tax=Guyanagaster necrorhizus TaxID=856835 RepID=A0A9P7VIZ3_9AGAR|nr:uncharacterized protein BT62DRAFT_1080234 [Guyanagaster necrorhizus MCA 3950]KAG7441225.1 hypothetical protein BT62DRAFT_1080234 [Guyanagaster necrorhizus MCA 3950]
MSTLYPSSIELPYAGRIDSVAQTAPPLFVNTHSVDAPKRRQRFSDIPYRYILSSPITTPHPALGAVLRLGPDYICFHRASGVDFQVWKPSAAYVFPFVQPLFLASFVISVALSPLPPPSRRRRRRRRGMFSSLNSLLPSVLHLNSSPTAPKPIVIEDDEDDVQEEAVKNESKTERREREKKASETFIFVRPPPAKSNHPLNLQVQLVPPNTRAPGLPTPRQSIDDTLPETPLSRTQSNLSSTSSFSSVSSTASGRRMIIPLYNLQAHNVMTNIVVDAGTDAKIAKFAKRGMELIDLAVMEPVEVWAASKVDNREVKQQDSRSSAGALMPPTGPSPASSAVSLSSAGSHAPSATSDKARKNLFGKMFKRNSKEPATPDMTPTQARHTRNLSAGSMHRSPSPIFPRRSVDVPLAEKEEPQAANVPREVLLPATLGIQPLLSISTTNPATYPNLVSLFTSSAYPPAVRGVFNGRGPAMYVWTVRRWLKGDVGSVLGGMLRGSNQIVVGEGSEVRVEWRRGKPKKKRAKNPNTPAAPRRKRTSVGSGSSTSATSAEGFSRLKTGEDDGEESDPEDSETPWTCTVKVKSLGPLLPRTPTSTNRNFFPSPRTVPEARSVKVKVGTLSPTPHHPKVVAMLKVPYPLPDVEVERVGIVRRRVVSLEEGVGEGGGRKVVSEGTPTGLVFTAEEIKDVVCSTGLWLVVREGFGGVGKVSRKGDGWRIRA